MSVVGIDLGNINTVIAVARNRGVDVICNEVSNRATPTLISFGSKTRYLGESAKTQEISNWKNTVSSVKRLVGRSLSEEEVQQVEKLFVNCELVSLPGSNAMGAKVHYQGEERVFSMIQLLAMFFSKVKEITQHEIKGALTDCVISVPGYFVDAQRRAILDAAEVAGLNCLRLLNDTTAAALQYGMPKTDLPEEKPRHVVIVDVGHSTYSVAVVAFIKGQLEVKSTAYDRHLGGRDFDQVLVDYFVGEFEKKYKIDLRQNAKALFRLRQSCEKAKKVLSANAVTNMSVENICNDIDYSAMISRKDFEAMCAPLLSRVEAPLREALEKAGLGISHVDSVEVVGGCTRIPAIKERLTLFFGKEPSTTLNQDEAVARGCALMCAMMSPVFKVRDFAVHDMLPYSIRLQWQPTAEDPDDKEVEIFSAGSAFPSTKMLTFYRKEAFEVEACYDDKAHLPRGMSKWMARYTIKNVAGVDGKCATVKVKVRMNGHGVLNVEQAQLLEEMESNNNDNNGNVHNSNESVANNDNSNVENNANQQNVAQPQKKTFKKLDLPLIGGATSLPKETVSQLKEQELAMLSQDKLVADTEERKNALEESVYELRGLLEEGGAWSDFASQEEKDRLFQQLSQTEEWLYDEGEEATKSTYQQRIDQLKTASQPIQARLLANENLARAEQSLRECIALFQQQAQSRSDAFDHIASEEKQRVLLACQETLQWWQTQWEQQSALLKWQPAVVTAAEVNKKRESLHALAHPIMSRPKPVPEPEPVTTTEAATNGENEASKADVEMTLEEEGRTA